MTTPDVHLCSNACCNTVLSAPLLWCLRCHQVRYCHKACQTQAWKEGHKRECSQSVAARRVQGELMDSHREFYNKVRELYKTQG